MTFPVSARCTLATLVTAALFASPAHSARAPSSSDALPPGLEANWLDKLNPDIDPDTAARIVSEDHPMGSQIRIHEGVQQVKDHPYVTAAATASVAGMDVSGYQGNVAWATAYSNGARFAYVKATEGTGYTNPYFSQQYTGSYNAGLIRGSYHFALPNKSSGATQANYFVDHGGGWSGDGKTLPGALDIEYNPYGATCYGLSQVAMGSWLRAFSNQYHARTGRYPTIYTSTSWWSQCVGTSANFSATSPLWVARYSSSVGTLPYGWGYYTIWQYADSGTFPGDQNRFNGAYDRLVALARG